MDASGLVDKKIEIVFDEQYKRRRNVTIKQRLVVTAITVVCFALVMVLIHTKHLEEKAMSEELSKRNLFPEIFGEPPMDAGTTKTKTNPATIAQVTEDPFDSWFESLFEPSLDQNTAQPRTGETAVSSSKTAAKSTTTEITSASTQAPDISTTTTTTTTIGTSKQQPNSSPSPETSTTPEATTRPACAAPDFRLAKVCIIPDQLEQQKNFNITYQDLVDAVTSHDVVTFWERCENDDSCTPDVDVNDIIDGLAETWINGNSKAQLCPWMDCLQFINQGVEFCMKDKERILNVTKMMCSFDFHINKEDRKCAGDVIGMLNRNMADEQERNLSISMRRCHDNFSPCQTECKKQYEDMMNMFDVTCLKYTTSLKAFSPWHWFSKHETQIKTSCNIDTGASVEDSAGHGYNYYDELIKDRGLVAGIVLSCVVVLIALLILSAVFVKRMRRGKYYDRDGVEYSEVTGLMAAPEEQEKHHF
ncbi:uncharacterized protein LOC135501877 [Lineus longissimus]|uniref:uncharacterized protein LOC135501877 n=1 Tax=Lineus longissimus TaxID=88925 RepID=UPI002B4EEC1A